MAVHRRILVLCMLLPLFGANAASAESSLGQEFAGASPDAVAALRKLSDACGQQMQKFWSYEAGQRCKREVDAHSFPTPELARFVGDLGLASFLVSQTGDACQKHIQGGQNADKEKPYKLQQCPYQEEAMPRLKQHLDKLDALLATRP